MSNTTSAAADHAAAAAESAGEAFAAVASDISKNLVIGTAVAGTVAVTSTVVFVKLAIKLFK